MRLEETLLVIPDNLAGGRLEVRSAQWRWNYGVDVIAPVRTVHQDGSAYSLAGAVAALLAFYENDTDDEPKLQLEWTITGSNTAEFRIPRSVAPLIPPTDRGYSIGMRFRDDDTGVEDVVLLPGRLVVARRVGDFAISVTVPPEQDPLARGPQGIQGIQGIPGTAGATGPTGPNLGHVANFAALPDPTTVDWLFYETDDTGKVYYSNGTAWVLVSGEEDHLVVTDVRVVEGGTRHKIFVRAGGDDSNNGQTALTAYRTIPRAFQDIPQLRARDDRWVVDITGLDDTIVENMVVPVITNGRTWYRPAGGSTDFAGFYYEGDITIQAIPTLNVTLNAGTLSQVVDAATGNVKITDTSKSWTVDQWLGVAFAASADGSDIRAILDSGTDWILVESGGVMTTPSIWNYGAHLHGDDFIDTFTVNDRFSGLFAFNGVRITASSTAATAMLVQCPTADIIGQASAFTAIEALNVGTVRFFSCTIVEHFNLGTVGLSNLISGLLLNITTSPASPELVFIGAVNGGSFLPNGTTNATLLRVLTCLNVDFIATAVRIAPGNTLMRGVKFTDCPGDVITVERGGRLQFDTLVRDGGGNVGVGLRVLPGGSAVYRTSDVPTVTGVGGNISVGGLAVRTWADLLNAPIGLEYDVFGGGALLSSDTTVATAKPELIVRVVAEGMGAGAVTLTGAKVGMRVVGVMNLSTGGTPAFFDASSNFESTISVAGQIQQLGAGSGAGVVQIIIAS